MELDEESLRQLMSSPHGETCGIALMNSVKLGTPLVILRGDGSIVTLADPSEAQNMLQALGWRTNYKTQVLRRHRAS
jgi:hypothetical protein